MEPEFPLPFPSTRVIDRSAAGASRFLVAAMYTPGYAAFAARLRASCEQFSLPYVLHEVPTVHTSISVKGTPDLAFTKPNFIRGMLDRHRRPILYLDADCVFRAYPARIDDLVRDGSTFAIYNWLADLDNETFYPIDVRLNGQLIQGRFYHYANRIAFHSTEQLICNGCVQLFDRSAAAAALLRLWHAKIVEYPEAPDDQCLSFAFNNGGASLHGGRWSWLPKEYARCAWSIFARPVIDHPELPALGVSGFKEIPRDRPVRHWYAERCETTEARFAQNSVIDVKDRLLYELSDGCLSLVAPLEDEVLIPVEGPAAATFDVTEIRATA